VDLGAGSWQRARVRGVISAGVLAFGTLACGTSHSYTWVTELPQADSTPRVRAGDTISVVVQGQEQLSGEFEVRVDGTYLQPVVGPIQVEGLLPEEVEARLVDGLQGVVVDPEVAVNIGKTREVTVYVLGEVAEPGAVEISGRDTVLSVLARAGGLTEFAKRNAIYVVREQPERMRVRFRYDDLTGGDPQSLAFKLRDGDAVVVE